CDELFNATPEDLVPGLFSSKDNSDQYTEEVLGFEIPGEADIADFDWFFDRGSYDDSSEEPFTDPYDVAGIWEMALWRKPDKKSQTQKELYWIDIKLTDKDGSDLTGAADMDISDAAELYGYDAFLNSDEAKALGIEKSEAAQNLLDALAEGDGSVNASATMIQVGVVDENEVWHEVNNAKAVQFTGNYYPQMTYVKLKDQKGNELKVNIFIETDSGEHGRGVYYPVKDSPMLNGMAVLYRK
nr:hypothetical protein [Lachnospiraceae bacterium]